MDLALTPRAGPVYLALPSDVAMQESASRSTARLSPALRASLPGVQTIADRIAASERPLLLIGLGATPAAAPAVAALIARLQAPFLVTPKVKGIVSEEHPLFLGVASGMALDREVVATLREADLVVGIGFDPVESDKTWFASLDVVALDTVSMAEGAYRPMEAVGELRRVDRRTGRRHRRRRSLGHEELLTAAPRGGTAAISRRADSDLSPLRLIEELRAVFPRDGIAACDVGSHKLAIGQFWRAYEPGTFLMANGLSGMGFGLPAAMAAQLVHPAKAVLAMVGDGGMLMMLHDLALIRELGLPIVIVVFTDASLSLIRLAAERRKFEPVGVDFQPPDFVAAARAFGIEADRASSVAHARELVERALTRRTPYLIEAPVDYREYRGVIG